MNNSKKTHSGLNTIIGALMVAIVGTILASPAIVNVAAALAVLAVAYSIPREKRPIRVLRGFAEQRALALAA